MRKVSFMCPFPNERTVLLFLWIDLLHHKSEGEKKQVLHEHMGKTSIDSLKSDYYNCYNRKPASGLL